MNLYKEFFKITFEMCLAIFIIIFSYTLWNTFDKNQYIVSKYYENYKQFDLYIEDETNKLYVHNIDEDKNITKIVLKTNKDTLISNNVVITFDNKDYHVKDLECIKEDNYCYYIINKIELNGYETKEFNYNIINDNINYEIVATI